MLRQRIWCSFRLFAAKCSHNYYNKVTTAIKLDLKKFCRHHHHRRERHQQQQLYISYYCHRHCYYSTLSSNRPNAKMRTLQTLNFDNLALKSLPIDSETGSRVRAVAGGCFSLVDPMPVNNPQTVAVSQAALNLIDIDAETAKSSIPKYFSGNEKLPGSQTAAHCYCGHQFGYFSGQLGDGAAMYLGEVVNEANERWEIQLKGAGLTPYSRTADGRKVLRSSIREFLCSEAMYFLGVPTTRAGSCVTSDSKVIRDIKYDGHPIMERCTNVLRIAPTFLRFGSFEIFKPRDPETMREGPSVRRKDVLDTLLNYTIKTFYTEFWREDESERENMLLEFYTEVLKRTARLVAHWQCIGWCHGVLNTDNMSIVGVTIDYGPYGFMDRFDPSFICNASDEGGRYTYANQPSICRWNCLKLGEAIQMSLPLEKSKPAIAAFDKEYDAAYIRGMRAKFGLSIEDSEDINLVTAFLNTMYETGCDFTNGFRCLSLLLLPGSSGHSCEQVLDKLLTECSNVEELLANYQPKIPPSQVQMFMTLIEQQPELAQALGRQMDMIKQEVSRHERREELKKLDNATKTARDREAWKKWLLMYKNRLSKEVLSNKSMDEQNKARQLQMNKCNPRFVLRNYVAQEVIEKAEEGQYSAVQNLLSLLEHPYDEKINSFSGHTASADVKISSDVTASYNEEVNVMKERYCLRPPPSANGIVVT